MSENFENKVRLIIQHRIQEENFGVSELAAELGLSRSQALRKIKAATGKSINRLIRDIRLEESTKLLGDEDLTASEIAYRVGFSSPSYFNKCFLDRYGVTPGEYKKDSENSHGTSIQTKSTSKKKPLFIIFFFLIIIITAIYSTIGHKKETPANLTSIAVLPLLDFSESHDKDYLTDGITEAITLELARNESIRVISRGSAMKYKNEKKLYSEIAEELGVDLLLEGSVLSGNNTLRVVVQLIKPYPEERHIWQNSYDRNHSDILGLIRNVSNEIASEISDVVEPDATRQKTYKVDPKAYDLYLRGRHLWNTQNIKKEALLTAVDYLKEALKIDPEFAQAYVTLAETYIAINTLIGDNEEKMQYRENARIAIDKALELDQFLAEAYVTKGNLAGKLDWDWETMKQMANEALQLEPSNANAHLTLSNYFVVKGEYNKAVAEALKAEVLDPLNPQIGCLVAERYYIAGDFNRSIEKYQEVIDLNPNYGFAYNNIGFVYFKMGDIEKAVEAWQYLQTIRGHKALYDCYDEHPYQYCLNFFLDHAKQNEPRFCSNPVIISSVQMLVDDKQGALQFLEIARQYKNEDLPVMITYPDFYALHQQEEFQKIAEEVGVKLPI
ncbi:helix-turn-helix domain-containing protein [Maribellus sediminis]|uniref:helix-turn-helix domain-containing protein n=1 Tax=Maribellus sediminis TaxID=2696285 RepID=UPI0014314746|nr:helix-turn-helix domain-containing protein [Maribellus sediminis]